MTLIEIIIAVVIIGIVSSYAFAQAAAYSDKAKYARALEDMTAITAALSISYLEHCDIWQAREGTGRTGRINGLDPIFTGDNITEHIGHRLSKKADLIAALSLEAFDGRIDPFMDCIQQIRPHQGQIETGEAFRKLLAGSDLIERHKEHVQDPYSFRCIPQVHGATKDAIRYVASVLLTEINSVTDNPTIFPDEDRIISGGNFHGQPLAISYDFLAIALAELGNISERRVSQLIMGLRGLPEFLVANPGLNSGFMIPQYAAASMVSQNKMYCYAASSDSIVSSNGQEDHVSMGANAATKLYKVMDNLEHILAIELMNAAQGIDFRRPQKTSPVLERFLHAYRKEVPFVKDDIVMYKEIHKTVAFMKRTQIEY